MYPQLFEENITAVEYWANPFNAENSTIKKDLQCDSREGRCDCTDY